MLKIRQLFLIPILFASLWAVHTPAAWACTCAVPDPPTDALAAADAVFLGLVTALETPTGAIISTADPIAVQFDVVQIWKGPKTQRSIVTTALDEVSCGYRFQMGESYLVYAQRIGQQLSVSLCSRTQPFDKATEDFAVLGQGDSPSMQPGPRSPLPTPSVGASLATPTPAPSVFGKDVSTWSSLSPDGMWIAEQLVALPITGEPQYYTQLIVRRLDQTIRWMPVAAWQDFGLGYTVPKPLRWSRDGRYLYFTNEPVVDGCSPFVNGSDLQRVDLRNGSVTQLLAPVTLVLALSPDEKTLAYRSRDGTELILLDLKTNNYAAIRPDLEDENAQFGAIVWAPDSRALAFTIQHTPCQAATELINSIVYLETKTYQQTPLIERDGRLFTTVAWPTPDQLVLTDPQGERWSFSLSGHELMLLEPAGSIPAPNGQWRASFTGEPGRLQLENASGKLGYELNFAGSVDQVAWSPDSERLVVVQTNRVFDGPGQARRSPQPTQLWQIDVGEEELVPAQRVFSASAEDEEGIVLGTWSPNGRYLLFWTDPFFSASALADGTPLWMLDTETGNTHLVTGKPPLSDNSALLNPRYQSWAPDSSALAITAGNYRSAQINKWLMLYDVSTQQATVVVSKTEQIPGIVAWSPQGDLIAYAAVLASETSEELADLTSFDNPAIAGRRIYLLDPATGEHWRLNDEEIFQDAPTWGEDGSTLYYVQQAGADAVVMAADPTTGQFRRLPAIRQSLAKISFYYGQFNWDDLLALLPDSE